MGYLGDVFTGLGPGAELGTAGASCVHRARVPRLQWVPPGTRKAWEGGGGPPWRGSCLSAQRFVSYPVTLPRPRAYDGVLARLRDMRHPSAFTLACYHKTCTSHINRPHTSTEDRLSGRAPTLSRIPSDVLAWDRQGTAIHSTKAHDSHLISQPSMQRQPPPAPKP